MITPELITKAKICDKGAAEKWAPFLAAAAEKYEINTPLRVAGWLAQCAHESNNFRNLVENLNYSQDGLLKTFPKYFTTLEAAIYARKPEKIANRVYQARMGNASELSGDGWKYRGRGLIQLTGKAQYKAYSQVSHVDVLENPDLVATPEHAAMTAAWFWKTNGLNDLADSRDIIGMSKRVNGGTNGLEHRKQLYAQITTAIA